jgi:NADH-quinone oxidoreductase subunit L
VGLLTLLVAGIAALLQNDIKRILAYSTMSQIGYMFLALGAGAYSAAVFHLATHACFKALLFLGAGAIGHLMHHEYSLLKVRGLGFKNPWLWGVFAVGLGSLTALPFVTSGFYSKEMILSQVLGSAGLWPWALGVLGAVLTGAYSARLFVLLFGGLSSLRGGQQADAAIHDGIDLRMKLPLGVLMALSVIAGFFPIPGIVEWSVMPSIEFVSVGHWPEMIAVCAGLVGIGVGARFVYAVPASDSFWSLNLGFDAIYTALILRPYEKLSFLLKADPIRAVYRLMVMLAGALQNLLLRLQTGNTLNYVTAMIVAVALFLAWVVYS